MGKGLAHFAQRKHIFRGESERICSENTVDSRETCEHSRHAAASRNTRDHRSVQIAEPEEAGYGSQGRWRSAVVWF